MLETHFPTCWHITLHQPPAELILCFLTSLPCLLPHHTPLQTLLTVIDLSTLLPSSILYSPLDLIDSLPGIDFCQHLPFLNFNSTCVPLSLYPYGSYGLLVACICQPYRLVSTLLYLSLFSIATSLLWSTLSSFHISLFPRSLHLMAELATMSSMIWSTHHFWLLIRDLVPFCISHWGKGSWKPLKTSREHCRMWFKLLTM
jgi:hypothetical protein